MFRKKNVYILVKDVDSKRKCEIKAKKVWLEKGLYFWVTLIQAVVSKTLRLFYKLFYCLINNRTLNNHPLSISTSRYKWGGAYKAPPHPWGVSFGKRPGSLRVKLSNASIFVLTIDIVFLSQKEKQFSA